MTAPFSSKTALKISRSARTGLAAEPIWAYCSRFSRYWCLDVFGIFGRSQRVRASMDQVQPSALDWVNGVLPE
jgi:hypothetical protein